MNRKELAGKQFGKLTVLYPKRAIDGAYAWLCRCECGNEAVVRTSHLTHGVNVSCGCYGRTVRLTHGMSYTPEWGVYNAARARCTNPKTKNYRDYGGRGIKFLFTGIESFIADIGHRPSPLHSLDRIDNNGHYEPGNVRWALRIDQLHNRRACKGCPHIQAARPEVPELDLAAMHEFYPKTYSPFVSAEV